MVIYTYLYVQVLNDGKVEEEEEEGEEEEEEGEPEGKENATESNLISGGGWAFESRGRRHLALPVSQKPIDTLQIVNLRHGGHFPQKIQREGHNNSIQRDGKRNRIKCAR